MLGPGICDRECSCSYISHHTSTSNMEKFFVLLLAVNSLQMFLAQTTDYADVVFLVDGSGTMGDRNFNQAKNFLTRTINQLSIGSDRFRIGLAQYSDDLQVAFLLNTYKAKNPILNHIKNKFAFSGGSIQTGNALTKVHEKFFNGLNGRDKSAFPPILVVLTSGSSLDDVENPSLSLRNDGVRIISMGLPRAPMDELETMASDSTLAFQIANTRELVAFSDEMQSKFQEAVQIPPDVEPSIPLFPDEPIPAFPDSTPGAYIDYDSINQTYSCTTGVAADVVFLVDSSRQTSTENQEMKKFIKDILSGLEISDTCVHVGLVTYSRRPTLIATLDQGIDNLKVRQLVDNIKVGNEDIANTGAAFNFTRTDIFSSLKGSRNKRGILQMAILITHRPSSDSITEASDLLWTKDVKVFSIGIAKHDISQLQQISSYPAHEYVVDVKSFSDLSSRAGIVLKKIKNVIEDVTFLSQANTDLVKDGCVLTEEADIYLLIDGSSSIKDRNFLEIKYFLTQLVGVFEIGPQKVRFGAVQYSSGNQTEFDIGEHHSKSKLQDAISNIQQLKKKTNTGAAMNYIRQLMLDPKNARNKDIPVYLIVLTDGKSDDSVKEAAEILRSHNIQLFAIGVRNASEAQLLEITGDKKRIYFVNNFDALKEIKNKVAREICSKKVCEDIKAEIIFLVDSSGSIGDDNYRKMKTFMKNMVDKTEVGRDRVQFGAVQFSDSTNVEFQLNDHSTKPPIMDAIDRMIFMQQNTDTGKALQFVSDYFKRDKGARPNVKKFLILITDGKARDEVKTPAESLRNDSVNIFSIGIFGANKTQLEEISGKKENVHYLETFELLKTIEDKLIFEVCTQTEDCKKITVADIVFVIDSSSSIDNKEYQIMKDFMISIVNKSKIDQKNVQIGALKYSNVTRNLFFLNTHSNKTDIINAIQSDQSMGCNTHTAMALRHSRTFFTAERGSRKKDGVPQYLIVLTDGESHDHAELNETSRLLEEEGITIFAIGIDEAKPKELQDMAGKKGKWFFIKQFNELTDIFTNITQAVCNSTECDIEEADVVFLIDGSGSISNSNFAKMKEFMVSVVNDFSIASDRVHVGVAQFSHKYKVQFRSKRFTEKTKLVNEIKNITQLSGNTDIGRALKETQKELFNPSECRIGVGVYQLLIVITDGKSRDDVVKPAQDLRNKGIDIYALGVGKVDDTQLSNIAGSNERKYSLKNFEELKKIKRRFVRNICGNKTSNCSIDIVVGFDISNQHKGVKLFYNQSLLENRLDGIWSRMSSLQSASCTPGAIPRVSVAFHVKNTNENVSSHFHIYNQSLIQTLKEVIVSGPTELTSSYLESMWDVFRKGNETKAKMLLIFTDGLNERTELLKHTADQLLANGLNALVTVALEKTHDIQNLKSIEVGRGINYLTQMNIGMSDIARSLTEEVRHVVERGCCCRLCTCTGSEGERGRPGKPGMKGSPGLKGLPGHEGDEGPPGERGPHGPIGRPGLSGSIGLKGPKGDRGRQGEKNENGEHGLDGVPGEQGVNGLPGKKGDEGDSGEQGKWGPPGRPGNKGSKGYKGDVGAPGFDNQRPSPKGVKGDPGPEGEPGFEGSRGGSGDKGINGQAGRRGVQGQKGTKGGNGEPGSKGDNGFKGPQGDKGGNGAKGDKGSNGPNGFPGAQGIKGIKGSPGNSGFTGKKGEPGDPGVKGSMGPDGRQGVEGELGIHGIGRKGNKGTKGPDGCPGYPGYKGESGKAGLKGDPGKKGYDGIPGGREDGDPGDPGTPGPKGPKGNKGPKGKGFEHCDLVNYTRNTCPCCKEIPSCPVYPTELVFALDMSSDVPQSLYQKMLDITTDILANITIRESNCPTGARVSVVSYNSYTKHLIRFTDYNRKTHLITAVKNIALEKTTRGRDIGGAMRFIGRNIFKRSLQGATVRKIVVLFSTGPSNDEESISTAVMEYSALGIIAAVITFTPQLTLRQAFSIGTPGNFQVIDILEDEDFAESVQYLRRCTICFDICVSNVSCINFIDTSEKSPLDIAFLLDNSNNMGNAELQLARSFLSMTIDELEISPEPRRPNKDRVALVGNTVHHSINAKPDTVQVEFDLLKYNNKTRIKRHIMENVHQMREQSAFGFCLEKTIDDILSKTPNLRKHKVIIIISFGETSQRDKQKLTEASLKAKCKGYGLFVISFGNEFNYIELTDLASEPLDHHLLQLGRIQKPNLDYAVRFLQPYLNSVRRGINTYPPAKLQRTCSRIPSIRPGNNKLFGGEEELFDYKGSFENTNDIFSPESFGSGDSDTETIL